MCIRPDEWIHPFGRVLFFLSIFGLLFTYLFTLNIRDANVEGCALLTNLFLVLLARSHDTSCVGLSNSAIPLRGTGRIRVFHIRKSKFVRKNSYRYFGTPLRLPFRDRKASGRAAAGVCHQERWSDKYSHIGGYVK